MPTLELSLDPAALTRLVRLPGIQASRPSPFAVTWFDTPDAALAQAGTCMLLAGRSWQIQRLAAPGPGQPPATLHSAPSRAALQGAPPRATRLARLAGRRRTLRHAGVTLAVLSAAPPNQPALCRVTLDGPATEILSLALTLAEQLPVALPPTTLSAQLLAPHLPPPQPQDPTTPQPGPHPGQDVPDTLAAIVGQLTATLLRWAPLVDPARPEAVHQMRVAIRRLRSALTVFRPAASCPELEELRTALQQAATRLGAARDWDVFLAGTAARMDAAYPGDKHVAALLRAARARRAAAYAGLAADLAGPGFRTLAIRLAAFAALRPWPETPYADIQPFAAAALARRAKKVRKAARDLEDLPAEALHELRKDCKRLRYTADFFASLFPGRPARHYTRRLAALQEQLGHLNDGAAVPGLLAQLGRLRAGYAAGLVAGFTAAHATPARAGIEATWRKFRKAERFWEP